MYYFLLKSIIFPDLTASNKISRILLINSENYNSFIRKLKFYNSFNKLIDV
jgi:hypothetical protein